MDKVLFTAMSGAAASERGQQLHANNLANARSTGFVADLAQARAIQVFGDGEPTRVLSAVETPAIDLAEGPMMDTGRPLDVAVTEGGFLAVSDASGGEAYTRTGHLVVDDLGALRTSTGLAVLGEGGPITLPPYERLTIGADGTISIQPQGEAPEVLAAVDRLKLVAAEPGAFDKGDDGLLRRRDGAPAEASATLGVKSGTLVDSNVNTVHEMVEVLTMARQFEMQVRLMRTAEQMDEAATTLVRVG